MSSMDLAMPARASIVLRVSASAIVPTIDYFFLQHVVVDL